MPPRAPRTAANSPARPRAYQRGAHLKRRGKIYYAVNGPFGRAGITLHTDDHAEAERRFAVEFAARISGKPGAAGGGTDGAATESTLADCALRWIAAASGYTRRTKESYEERMSAFVAWCDAAHVTLPSEVTAAVVDRWIAARAVKVSRRTVNRDLRPVRTCLRWCAENGLCKPVKAVEREGLREPKPLRHKLLPDPVETTRVLTAVRSQGYRDALVIYYATGLRYEELLRVGVGDVHDGHVFVQPEEGPAAVAEPTKGYRGRMVPIAAEVRDVIVRHLAWRDPTKRGRHAHKNALHRAIKAACVVAKVPVFGLHDLRRCFATESVRRGVPLTVVREWMGHQLVATTEGYVGRYRSDASIPSPVSPVVVAAESLLKGGAEISTNVRRISSKGTRRGE